MLDNLLDNARKYDDSGEPIRIEGREDGEVVIAVADEGPAICGDLAPAGHLRE